MGNSFKVLLYTTLLAGLFTACQEEVNSDLKTEGIAAAQATGSTCNGGTAPTTTVHLGLNPDSDGNFYVDEDITLSANTLYILHNYYRITSGHTITIEAGTEIHGTGGTTPGTLVIERGADIIADGTTTCPIVFTSNETIPAPGDWGGLVILGNAPVNVSAAGGATPSGTNGLGIIEGLPTPNNTGYYGGSDAADNSGILRYVRIEYAGNTIGTDNELNGLTLGGVGSGTTLSYVQVSFGEDDGFEFFGGTVNGDHLIANRNGDDDFDTDQGYSGSLQFGVVVRDPDATYLSTLPLNGSETNGDDGDAYQSRSNFTRAQLSNFTIVGPYQNDCSSSISANYVAGINWRDGSMEDLYNSVILGFPEGIEIEYALSDWLGEDATSSDDSIDVRNVYIVTPNQADSGLPPTVATWNVNSAANFNTLFESIPGNDILAANSCTANPSPAINSMAQLAGLRLGAWDAIDDDAPDLRPFASSPLLGHSSLFSGLTSLADFDETVTYIGAFDQTTNWMSGWTNWDY